MLDKAALGIRYACYECGTKFYDLNRPEPLCPECSADQRNAPQRDTRSLLGGGKGSRKRYADTQVAEEEKATKKKKPAKEEDDDLGLLGSDDDDDDDGGDDDDDDAIDEEIGDDDDD